MREEFTGAQYDWHIERCEMTLQLAQTGRSWRLPSNQLRGMHHLSSWKRIYPPVQPLCTPLTSLHRRLKPLTLPVRRLQFTMPVEVDWSKCDTSLMGCFLAPP